jgi:hypothetical protein
MIEAELKGLDIHTHTHRQVDGRCVEAGETLILSTRRRKYPDGLKEAGRGQQKIRVGKEGERLGKQASWAFFVRLDYYTFKYQRYAQAAVLYTSTC